MAVVAAATTCAMAQNYIAQEISVGGFATSISNGVAAGYQGTPGHATLWTSTDTIDVHPTGYAYSAIYDIFGNTAVGNAGPMPAMWTGASMSLLSSPFAIYSGRANATDGAQAVGYVYELGVENASGPIHGIIWNLNNGTSVDLGKDASVSGVRNGMQVGFKSGSKGQTAGFWRGTRQSYVDLHVKGQSSSVATDTDGTIQIGYIGLDVRVRNEARPRDIRFYSAGIWSGSASSFQYLGSTYRHSFALNIQGDTISGYGNTTDAIGTPKYSHAIAWVGPDRNFVDLHAALPADMLTSTTTGIDANGNIIGYGMTTTGAFRSYLWVRQ